MAVVRSFTAAKIEILNGPNLNLTPQITFEIECCGFFVQQHCKLYEGTKLLLFRCILKYVNRILSSKVIPPLFDPLYSAFITIKMKTSNLSKPVLISGGKDA
uniref:Uncharacterized protein n=1 Tax=Glossina pallidipes TaxID=7398 RepID=A0A1A9ZRB3_GLOPL